MAKSIQEIKTEILNELHIGIDVNEGSFISSLVGAISTQIAMLEETIDNVKTQQLPEFADMETLVLLGRKCGLYPMAATASQISIIINGDDPGYAVGDTVRFKDSTWAYTVQSHDTDKKLYVLECVDLGTAPNAIPPSWYRTDGVEIEPRSHGDPSVKARVAEILRQGRDDEDISQFRIRVTSAYNVAPVSANAHWVRTVLTQSDLNIGCVRIRSPLVLKPELAATAWVYVGGPEYSEVNQRKIDACKQLLSAEAPLGMVFEVDTIRQLNQTKVEPSLQYTFQIAQEHLTVAWESSATETFATLIKQYIRKLVDTTSPREEITIVPGALVGELHVDKTYGPTVVSALITYMGKDYVDEPVTFAFNHIPWVTPEQIVLVDDTLNPIQSKSEYPEF